MENTETVEEKEIKEALVVPVSTGNEGVKKEEYNLEEANKALDVFEARYKDVMEKIKKADDAYAERIIRGRASAGTPNKTEEQIAIEEANKLMEGTGLSPF